MNKTFPDEIVIPVSPLDYYPMIELISCSVLVYGTDSASRSTHITITQRDGYSIITDSLQHDLLVLFSDQMNRELISFRPEPGYSLGILYTFTYEEELSQFIGKTNYGSAKMIIPADDMDFNPHGNMGKLCD